MSHPDAYSKDPSSAVPEPKKYCVLVGGDAEPFVAFTRVLKVVGGAAPSACAWLRLTQYRGTLRDGDRKSKWTFSPRVTISAALGSARWWGRRTATPGSAVEGFT